MALQTGRVCFLFVALYIGFVNSEKFTALKDLEQILHAENNVAHDLRDYVAQEEARLDVLRKLAEDFETHSSTALSNPEQHLGNPVSAFLLVKRFTTDWDNIVANYISSNSTGHFLERLTSKTDSFPNDEDLTGAAMALMRLQDTYALPTEKIARGELLGVKNSQPLTAEDCFELGRHTYNQGDYYHTVLWMQEALAKYEQEDPKTVGKSTILDYLAFSVSMQGNLRAAYNFTVEFLKLEPDHVRAQNNLKYYEKMIAEAEEEKRKKGDEGVVVQEDKIVNKRPTDDYRSSDEFRIYEQLCRDEETQYRTDIERKLFCYYKRHHPIFYIRPLKEEVMNLKPRIVIFHDVLTNEEIEKVKELASPRLHRATVQNPQTGNLETALYRISKSAWLKDHEHKLIERISQRSAKMSNLTLETVEELQVVNYGIGGHYEPHYDFARKREAGGFEEWRGNRIATVIYYMSDVEAGGFTVFPEIGVKLKPTKGSCAVWYNLLESGEGDYLTRHAACPVLVGNKWACNKWFHERGQEFVRPCGLTADIGI